MKYLPLKEAGKISVEYNGPEMDTLTHGILQINIHEIVEKVAFGLIEGKLYYELPPSRYRRYRYYRYKEYLSFPPIVKANIKEIKSGSIIEELGFCVALAIADPDVRAVLQNLSATIIYAITTSGYEKVRKKIKNKKIDQSPEDSHDPFDIGPNIRDIAMASIENNGGRVSKLTFRHENDDGIDEVEIEFGENE